MRTADNLQAVSPRNTQQRVRQAGCHPENFQRRHDVLLLDQRFWIIALALGAPLLVAAETAVDAYGAFMAKLHAYIITPKGSGIVAARSALQRANSETTDAIAEINRQRRHYGFGNI